MATKGRRAALGLGQVHEFELVYSQLDHFHEELQALTRGRGNDALNGFKLSLLRNLLKRANSLLGSQYEAIAGFQEFDPAQVPSTSDALLFVSQYLGALEKLRADNITMYGGAWYWLVDGERSELRTAQPAKLNRR